MNFNFLWETLIRDLLKEILVLGFYSVQFKFKFIVILGIHVCTSITQYGNLLSSPSQKKVEKFRPSPGFEPGSPRPQFKSDNLDRSAIGPNLLLCPD